MKRLLAILLTIVMALTVYSVSAISEGATENDEEEIIESVTRTGDEELENIENDALDEDDFIPADSILPTSTDRVIYLALSEDEETGHAVYAKFPKPTNSFILESDYNKAIAVQLDTGCGYSYATGAATSEILPDSDDENAVPILEGYTGINAWMNAENSQAWAIVKVPGAGDAILVLTIEAEESENLSLEEMVLDEIERLSDSIALWDSEKQPEKEEEEIAPNANVAVKSVKLNISSQTVCVGVSFSLTASISPSNASNKKVTWSSSNSSIATVSSNGTVTGKKAGSCTITAKSNNGKIATCKITVKARPAVTRVAIVGSSSLKIIGGGYAFHAECYPNSKPGDYADQTVTWSSSNPKVATVTKDSSGNGIVKATGYGTAVITATSKNGKKATRQVIVERENAITRNYVVSSSSGFKFQDTMTIYLDGVTGKVTRTSCSQSGSMGMGVGVTHVDIKEFKKEDHYAEFKSRWTIYVGLKSLGLSADCKTYTYHYRLTDTGTLTLLRKY